jgi:pyrimidine operon attenuation protein / uracil phosphoribosyltransferase
METNNSILTAAAAQQKMQRMALELAENIAPATKSLILIGIRNNGVVIANKIAALIAPYVHCTITILEAILDKDTPSTITYSAHAQFTGAHIVLVDDVSNSGKTLLYAIKPLLDFYPVSIQTLVLVERMYRLYPVKPDYVGLSISTSLQDHIRVMVTGTEIDGVCVETKA